MRFMLAASVLGAALVLNACAGNTAEEANVDETSEELSTLAQSLVGSYTYANIRGNYEEYDSFVLEADGTYAATKPSKGEPIQENGTYRTSSGDLVLHPAHAATKRYALSVAADKSSIKLTRAGRTEKLDRNVPPATCASNDDCASGEECRFVSICPPPRPGGVSCMAGINKCVPVVQLGESCGFRNPSKTCATGLDCRHVSGPLDALTCAVHIAGYDESCGGFIRTAAICDEGLVCTHVGSDGQRLGNPDLPGVCRAAEGAACGGFIANAHECAYPMHCQLGANPDAGGTCQP
jgi:hypothetical protein